MNKIEFDNPMRRQVMSLPDLVEEQLIGCFDSGLKELISMAEFFDVRKIILTGVGDSYAAAITMAPVIEKYCDCFGVQVMRTVEFTRFLSKADIGIGEPNSPLVIGISVGGGTSRIVEALQKANEVGAFSVLITNKEDSAAAKVAKRVYIMHTPSLPGNDAPGLRSYFASQMGLIALASRMGHVRGTLPPTGPDQFKTAIKKYVEHYRGATLESIDNQMFALAQRWKDFERFDFIGDGVEFGSAFFGAAKFLECNGCAVSVDDSEDWCHINFFVKNPQTIGTVVMADKYSPSFSRIVETVNSAHRIGRPVLVVTNSTDASFDEGVEICVLPEPQKGFGWILPLMDHIPVSLLAGYITTLSGECFFRTIRSTGEHVIGSPFANRENMSLNNSKIEIYE